MRSHVQSTVCSLKQPLGLAVKRADSSRSMHTLLPELGEGGTPKVCAYTILEKSAGIFTAIRTLAMSTLPSRNNNEVLLPFTFLGIAPFQPPRTQYMCRQ